MNLDWTQIDVFKGIDLNDSFVLNWSHEGNQLIFYLEASIWPGSKYYTGVKKGEYTCYRQATLAFVGINDISGLLPIETAASTTDPDGSVDYGTIESFQAFDGMFELSGDFGKVKILGGEFRFEVHA